MLFLEHMQEDKFEKLVFNTTPENCNHEIVKLYYWGTHTDYGCKKCGKTAPNIETFRKR